MTKSWIIRCIVNIAKFLQKVVKNDKTYSRGEIAPNILHQFLQKVAQNNKTYSRYEKAPKFTVGSKKTKLGV